MKATDILAYLKARFPFILCFALSAGLTLALFSLAGTGLKLPRYAIALALFLFVLTLLFDGARFCRRRIALRRLRGRLECAAELPEPMSALEADYRALVRSLLEDFAAYRTSAAAAHEEDVEYYTLWIHQIKTPIAAMRLVLQNDGSAVLRQELLKIDEYADMALKYVKLGHVQDDILIEPCEPALLARAAVRKYSLLFIYKKLSANVDDIPETVLSDKKWLGFILEQLVSNAVKYTRTGRVYIYMEGGRLCVKDSGIGIRPEDLPRIFERGYTGVNGRRDSRASGIGLYLAKKAADALGITLKAESVPGRGTSIYLSFPPCDLSIYS